MAYLAVMFIGLILAVSGHWFIGLTLTIATFIMGLLIDFD